MDLIKKLEEYRLKNKITQERLAEMLGFSFGTVNRWFNGKFKPSRIATYQIKKLLKVKDKR